MNQAISPQHPAVVLRSHYQHLRALLAVAMIAVVGLAVAVVILATNGGGSTRARVSSGSSAATSTWRSGSSRYDGGPEEGSLFATPSSQSQWQNPAYNYNGGHDEGNALR
jgi:hypothetical protein